MSFAFSAAVNLVVGVLGILVPLLGAVLVGFKAAGPARALGIAGCALLAAGRALTVGFGLVAARLMARFDHLAVATTVGLVVGLLTTAGVALLILAVVAGRPPAR